jgi:hypothetical protein
MQRFRAITIFLLSVALAVGSVSLGMAGDGPTLQGKRYEGRITSITIDRCGVEPGQCIGSIVLGEQSNGGVELGIRPGTWIKHGDRFILIEDLRVGTYVRVQAVDIPGDRLQQMTGLVVEPHTTRVRRLLLPCPSAWQTEDTPCS